MPVLSIVNPMSPIPYSTVSSSSEGRSLEIHFPEPLFPNDSRVVHANKGLMQDLI